MAISINGAKILATFENVPLFGTVQITQTLTASWLVMLIISALCIWLGSGLRVTNISRKQAVAELAVTSLLKFVRGNMGTGFDHYIPLIGTIFITSVVSNLISLIGVWSPTADLMTELAWALVVRNTPLPSRHTSTRQATRRMARRAGARLCRRRSLAILAWKGREKVWGQSSGAGRLPSRMAPASFAA